jgi:hypothetical protein
MVVKQVVITSFAKFMLGGTIFNEIKNIVQTYLDADLTGQQKREQAFKDCMDILQGVAGWVVGLGIELAVAYFKTLEKK